MFDLKVDTKALEEELKAHADELPQLTKAALTVGIEWLFAASKRLLTQLIYGREIPKWRNGNPKWRRKIRQGLLGAETYSVASDGQSAQIFTREGSEPAKPITNYPGGYAQKQHERTKNPANWREQAKAQNGDGAVEKARAVIADGLRNRR